MANAKCCFLPHCLNLLGNQMQWIFMNWVAQSWNFSFSSAWSRKVGEKTITLYPKIHYTNVFYPKRCLSSSQSHMGRWLRGSSDEWLAIGLWVWSDCFKLKGRGCAAVMWLRQCTSKSECASLRRKDAGRVNQAVYNYCIYLNKSEKNNP